MSQKKIVCYILLFWLLCNWQFIWKSSEEKRGHIFLPVYCKKCRERWVIFHTYQIGNSSLPLKNSSVPRDMLVLSVMTLSADLLRQIATDPHGFFQGTLDWKWTIQFPTGSLAITPLCITETASSLGSGTEIFTEGRVRRGRSLKF